MNNTLLLMVAFSLSGCSLYCDDNILDETKRNNFDKIIEREGIARQYGYTTILYGEKCEVISKFNVGVKHCFANKPDGKYEIIKGNLELTGKIKHSIIEMPFTGGRAIVVWDSYKIFVVPIDEKIKIE